MILNCGFEIFKDIKDIWFEFKQVNPCEFGKIINKDKIISKIIDRNNRYRTTYITMNEFKRFIRLKNWFNKGKLMHFSMKVILTVCYNSRSEFEYIRMLKSNNGRMLLLSYWSWKQKENDAGDARKLLFSIIYVC